MEQGWSSVELTWVVYPTGSKIGHVLAFSSLMPVLMLAGLFTLLFSKRDLAPALCLWGNLNMSVCQIKARIVGLLWNEALNNVLKKAIKAPRPSHRDGYGMPSSHAQFMAFFMTYYMLRLYLIRQSLSSQSRHGRALLLLLLTLVVIYSRVYLLYHTWAQIGVGFTLGCVCGLLHYFFFVRVVYRRWIHPWLFVRPSLGYRMAQWCLLRDTSDMDNVLRMDYDGWLKQRGKVKSK